MIGLPHTSATSARAQPETDGSPSPKSASLAPIMDVREGRIGNAFACERCRKHKVRCVPSDTPSICQRCQKARVECVEHVARRRPAKARTDGQTPSKLRDFDKKLDKLSAIVATMAPSPAQTSLPSVVTIPSQLAVLDPPQQAQTAKQAIVPTVPLSSAPTTALLPSPGSQPENSLPFWESFNETLSCLGQLDPLIRSISLVHMQMLLDTYRGMVDYFPFVVVPRDCRCQDLFHNRPMLLFAVLTAASYDSPQLRHSLGQEFRKVVMVKIMQGEKSLDLLQGLLVFIAWHQHYMDAQAVSITLLLQLCLGIAHDLGLDNISRAARSPLHKDDPRDKEAKRAYLGCYYLSSNIGLMQPLKARSMSHTTTVRNYASELASSWENKTDTVLPILMDVCQYMEDVEETFRSQSEQAVVVRTQVNRLNEKWENIRLSSKLQANDFATLQWLQLAARIHLYRIAASVDLVDRDCTPWASGFQLSLRVTYVRSLEQFLDNTTKLSSNQFESISLIDWLNLVNTITSLSKLTLYASPIPGWDPSELQLARTFDHYRDQLSSLMPRPRDTSNNREDAFERFRRITSTMRLALHDAPGRGSPNGTTFELSTGSGRTVSLLHNLALPKINGGITNGAEKLPSLRDVNPSFDVTSNDFHWKFLLGTV
ncbi:hypothetical protein COCCADRAFT_87763 [Bipolaris zeicola 26-R-13]|uniref:Zn(2)-C6 fungal-type domain-containing protein n=1 Tax=Cochliobolus carbonum (strain 26-R-13) TaxID=930089 RepID=W6YYL8_COCC2|nr:uncharacterized protein COCCADRAFT_87763 [Bipolaris zeicola 26-R-13]EUC36546.1 hypothetical protein COCCADRAFT_87763 [Bipolaris zeicola 26-R-13]